MRWPTVSEKQTWTGNCSIWVTASRKITVGCSSGRCDLKWWPSCYLCCWTWCHNHARFVLTLSAG